MNQDTATQTREFTITRTFDAPRAAVWSAWTESDQMGWMCPVGMSIPPERATSDVRVGGRFSAVMIDDAAGWECPTSGEYLEVNPPEKLVFSWADPTDPTSVSVCTVTLTADGDDRTTMDFHLLAPGPISPEDGARRGWGSTFDNLATALAA